MECYLTFADTSKIPTFNHQPTSAEQKFTLFLIDLSIASARIDASKLSPAQLPLAPGITANRTTRLHFAQTGLSFSTNGTLVNSTEPVAYYNGPAPPAGDIAHDYVFYLFEQPKELPGPPQDSPFNAKNVNANPNNRQSFDVQKFATEEGIGNLIAANYFQVWNSSGTASSTGSNSAGGSASPTTGTPTGTSPPASTFTGAAPKFGSNVSLLTTGLAAWILLLFGW